MLVAIGAYPSMRFAMQVQDSGTIQGKALNRVTRLVVDAQDQSVRGRRRTDQQFLDRYLRQGVPIRVGEGDESSVRLKVLR